jgi:pimeloyl-ACP methyl ester carboxylesterase
MSWGLAIEPLAASHRVIAPDLPGYGESDRPDVVSDESYHRTLSDESYHRTYTNDYYIDVLDRLLHALRIKKPSLVGISMGGGIALGFSLRWPDRVNRLVLVDSYGLADRAPSHRLSYLFLRVPFLNEMTWATIRYSRSLARWSLSSIFHDPSRMSDDLVDEVWAESKRPRAGKAFAHFQNYELGWRGLRTVYVDRLGEIKAQTLIVHGAEDRLVPIAAARVAHDRIAGSQLHIIPGCGHWPQRERPDEFNEAIVSFLQD